MDNTKLVWLTLLSSLWFVLGLSDDTRPNIIFIFADDWGWNDVSYHGGSLIETDFLDSLATTESLILSQHYVQPTCTPSRAAFLTGKYPANIGMQHSTISPGDIYGVPLDETFLSEEMSSLGYTTHMIGKWHLGFCAWEYTPLYRGFDTFSGFLLGAESYSEHNRSVGNMNGFDLRRQTNIVKDADGTYSTFWHYDEMTTLFTELETQSDPFFIYLAWQNSHNPPEAPKSYLKKYKDVASGARWFFMGQTAVLDDVMEDLINDLKEHNLWDNTLIVFSSDNGAQQDSGDNAPLRGAKSTLWEGAIRVPAFITGGYLPENMRGKTTNEMIHITDWYSTFINLGSKNLDNNEHLNYKDGFDITNVILKGENTQRKDFLINVDPVSCTNKLCGAIRYENYKLIIGGNGITSSSSNGVDGCFWTREFMSDETSPDLAIDLCGTVPSDIKISAETCLSCNSKDGKGCLYDLDNDPCEYYNLANNDEYNDIYDQLYSRLEEYWYKQVYPWKDIYQTDYTGADPSLHDDFWSPWLSLEELKEKQSNQYILYKNSVKVINSEKIETKNLENIDVKLNFNDKIKNNNGNNMFIIVGFVVASIICLWIIYKWIVSRKSLKDKTTNFEKNPLLIKKNNTNYSTVH